MTLPALNTRRVIDCIHNGTTTAEAIGTEVEYATHTVQATLDALEREGVIMRREDEYRLNPFFREGKSNRRWVK
jgi:DNA-binding IclR family transcriptional regulator